MNTYSESVVIDARASRNRERQIPRIILVDLALRDGGDGDVEQEVVNGVLAHDWRCLASVT